MQFLAQLWMPILISSVAVFILSALAWTVLPHHQKDYGKIPNEDAISDAIRAGNVAPGLYSLPHAGDPKLMQTPEMMAKYKRGPRAFITIAPPWTGSMGPQMAQSFLTNLMMMAFVGYVAYHAIAPGAAYLAVFRVVGTITFMTFAFGQLSDSVWFSKPWGAYLRHAADSLVYGLVAGGVFGWLWY